MSILCHYWLLCDADATVSSSSNKGSDHEKVYILRLDRGGGQQIFLSCACLLITQPLLNIYRHAIHQIKAEYHSYRMVLIILYNLNDVKLKIVKEIET